MGTTDVTAIGERGLTSSELDAIEARANAATPGPWERGATLRERDGKVTTFSEEASVYPPLGEAGPVAVATVAEYDNASFIAHARQDVPALVAEVRRLRGLLAAERALAAQEDREP
jgi:hypothetical protein